MLDRDIHDRNFLDYAFEVDAREVIQLRFISGVINNMWDQGRLIKSSFFEYSALYQLDNFKTFAYTKNFKPVIISKGFKIYRDIEDFDNHKTRKSCCFFKCKKYNDFCGEAV